MTSGYEDLKNVLALDIERLCAIRATPWRALLKSSDGNITLFLAQESLG